MSFHDDIAARTIWGEARGEDPGGKLAVAHVIRNRMKNGRWGKTAGAVCLANMQFSCWNPGDPNRKLMLELPESDTDLYLCRQAWDASGQAGADDPTRGSQHYKVVGTYAKWADGIKPTVTIGHHDFYAGIA